MHKYVQADYLVRKYVHAEYILRISSRKTKLLTRYGISFAQVECIQLQCPAMLRSILHFTTANQAGKSPCQTNKRASSASGVPEYRLLAQADVPVVEFVYRVFTRMPRESYRRRLRSLLLCLCDVFWARI